MFWQIGAGARVRHIRTDKLLPLLPGQIASHLRTDQRGQILLPDAPYPHRLVLTAGGEEFAVGTERHGGHRIWLSELPDCGNKTPPVPVGAHYPSERAWFPDTAGATDTPGAPTV